MRLYPQFFIVAAILLLLSTGSIVYNGMQQERKLKAINQERVAEFRKTFRKIVALKSSDTSNYVYDYSYWDELVDFLKSRDMEWAHVNIDATMKTFRTDYMYIVDEKGNEVYHAYAMPDQKDIFASIDKNDFNFNVPVFHSYFIITDTHPVEIFVAPIQRSADIKRTGKIYGYLVGAKIWTPELVKEFEQITQQRIRMIDNNATGFTFIQPLYGKEAQPVAGLGVVLNPTTDTLLREMVRMNLGSMILIGLVGVVGLMLFIYIRIIRPTYMISSAMRKRDGALIRELSEQEGEFGRIAGLVRRSFEEKNDLERQLTRAEEAEAEQLRLQQRLLQANEELEAKVYERTSELESINRTLDERVQNEIDRRRKQERMMIQQNRLAAMGEMIGNIAHQWRQPLNALGLIVQDVEDAHRFGELDDEYIRTMSSKAMEQINYMSRTIEDFRNFFKPDRIKERFSLNDNLARILEIVGPGIRKSKVQLGMVIHNELSISGYPNELAQVIINIINNAKEAFESSSVVERTIHVEAWKEAGYVYVSIADNAGGIEDTILHRIFDPYFTTKGETQGTGLGLYMAKVIVEEHMHGKITAENEKEGVKFVIMLPEDHAETETPHAL